MGPMFTIEHGVPKEVAEVMLEQIIQEFAAGCESLTKKLARDKIQNKVEEFKKVCRRGDSTSTWSLTCDILLNLHCYKLIFRHVKSPRLLSVPGSPEIKKMVRNKGYAHESE
jgi:hypothetical protein